MKASSSGQRRIAGIVGLVLAGWIAGGDGAGSAGAATVNVPPVVVTSLAHSRFFYASPPETNVLDGVYMPTGGGTYTGPGFAASIGTGDTIVVRMEAQPGKTFSITPGPGANATNFNIDLYWHAGVSDVITSPQTPTITFENFQGTAMTSTYKRGSVSDAGQAVSVQLYYTVNAPCSFSAVQISFPVTHALASTLRTYSAVRSSFATGIFAVSVYNYDYPGSPTIMTLATLPVPGACCRGATCTVTIPASCTGGTALHLGGNIACNPTVRGGTVNACCPIDINQDAAANLTDLFAFINGWFVGCP